MKLRFMCFRLRYNIVKINIQLLHITIYGQHQAVILLNNFKPVKWALAAEMLAGSPGSIYSPQVLSTSSN